MRLIGAVENEKQAFVFYSFLLELGIHSTYEPQINSESHKEEIYLWVYEEEAVESAIKWLETFKTNPNDPKFANIPLPFTPPQPPDLIAERQKEVREKSSKTHWGEAVRVKKVTQSAVISAPFTFFILLLCTLLYILNSTQQIQLLKKDGPLGLELGTTPLQRTLFFDYPLPNQEIDRILKEYPLHSFEKLSDLPPDLAHKIEAAQNLPSWPGIIGLFLKKVQRKPISTDLMTSSFGKIREGEVWRLLTPCFLHGGLLHILFNMVWAWILLKQMEKRLSRWKILLLILVIGVLTNIAQYLMSGPFFLGFSGVIVGLVSFIWVRQKVAPWEGYPLHRSVILFIFFFVGAMFVIDLASIGLTLFGVTNNVFPIANTAHIVGGLIGILLARLPLFSRGMI